MRADISISSSTGCAACFLAFFLTTFFGAGLGRSLGARTGASSGMPWEKILDELPYTWLPVRNTELSARYTSITFDRSNSNLQKVLIQHHAIRQGTSVSVINLSYHVDRLGRGANLSTPLTIWYRRFATKLM